MKRMGRRIRGVTLVEVMIILVIIALLLAMAIPALQKIKQGKHDREKAAAEAEAVPTRP
jgi:type IV pilus assembly protein PilA